MFHNPSHLIETTISKDSIRLAYINRSKLYPLLNPFAKHTPAFLSVDLSKYFGESGLIHAHRVGKEFLRRGIDTLESVFCTVIFCDDEVTLKSVLQDINLAMIWDHSEKWPVFFVMTPNELTLNDTFTRSMITQHVHLPMLAHTRSSQQQAVMLNAMSIPIGDALTRIKYEESSQTNKIR